MFDEKVCDWIENFYLWWFDRTGVMLATVAMTIILIAYFLMGAYTHIVGVFLLGLVGLFWGLNYNMQASGKHELCNGYAIAWRGATFRLFCTFYNGMSLIMGFVVGPINWNMQIGTVLMILYGYICCIRLRDRDKKPFFEPKLDFATNAI
jgi:hypothetical protein